MILIDDLQAYAGISDVDADCDQNLAKAFAVMKSVLRFINFRKSEDRCQGNRARESNGGGVDVNDDSSPSVTLVAFSAPLQSRGSSFAGVCEAYFDSIFELGNVNDSQDEEDVLRYSMTPIRHRESGYRFLFTHQQGQHIKLDSIQFQVRTS